MRVGMVICVIVAFVMALAVVVRQPRAARSGVGAVGEVGGGEHACFQALRVQTVAFQRLDGDHMPDVRLPIRLQSALAGVEIHGGTVPRITDTLDCRLAGALLRWAPDLRRAGVTQIDHYSMYRRNSRKRRTGHISAHAYGMAIDVAKLHLHDGSVLSVLDDWGDRRRGANPCAFRLLEDRAARRLRHLVCRAADRQLFNMILTPHYDQDHQNHVHMELAVDRDGYQIH